MWLGGGGGGRRWTIQDMTSLMCELGEHNFLNKDWRQDLNAVKPSLQRYQRAKAKCLYYKGACTIKKEKAGSLASRVPKRTVCDRKVSMKRRVQLFLVYMKLTK